MSKYRKLRKRRLQFVSIKGDGRLGPYIPQSIPTIGPSRQYPGLRVAAFWGASPEPVVDLARRLVEADARRKDDPPDFEAKAWTWSAVEFAFRGALRVMAALPDEDIGPGQVKALWVDYRRDYPGEARATRARPTGRQIDQAEAILPYLLAVKPEKVRRGIIAFCSGLSWARIHEIANDYRTDYHLRGRVYRAVFLEIAEKLNAEKKLLPIDVADVPFFGL